MPASQILNRNPRERAGAVLLGLSTLLMLGNVSWVAIRLTQMLTSFGADAVGLPVAASQALLKLFRTIAFDPSALSSFGLGTLVLFLAPVGIVSGLMLLHTRSVERAG